MIDRVFIDMDGVLVDFVRGALTPDELAAYEKISKGKPSLWGFLGITEDEFWQRTIHPDWWFNLPQLPWCFQLMHIVDEHFPNAEVFFLTKPHSAPNCIPGKERWISEILGYDAGRVICTKHKTLFARSGSLLIDDTSWYIGSWNAAGGHGILFPALSNELHEFESEAIYFILPQLKELQP